MSSAEHWLKTNQTVRMDANSPLFPESRRAFHLDRYKFAADFCSGLGVLDGACGTGYGTAVLARTAKRVVGIDCDADSIRYAQRVYGRPNIEFLCSYVENTGFDDDSFDVVVSFETVEHTLCPRSHMMEIVRTLRPTGKAIVSVPNAWGYTDHHFFDFSLPMLQDLVRRFFGRAQLYSQDPQGSAHPGIHALSAQPSGGQCILALCEEPDKSQVAKDRYAHLMDEIYTNAFARHNEFRTLLYRQNTSLVARALKRARLLLAYRR
jgi:SAM-dependent methyltransferase